jgi:uracil-DNA glycosylase
MSKIVEISSYCRRKDFHCIHNVKFNDGKTKILNSEEIYEYFGNDMVVGGVKKVWLSHFQRHNNEKIKQTEKNQVIRNAWIDNNSEEPERWSFDKIAQVYGKNGWEKFFMSEDIQAFLEEITLTIYSKFGPSIVPLKKDIFNAFAWCPFDKLKVVIVGQDPYYTMYDGIPQAWGACFATRRDFPLQPSLKNIYIEVKNCYPDFQIPDHGDLRGWAKQGVLLLNACLTTQPFQDRAHKDIWDSFIHFLFKKIREEKPDTIVVMWGREAQKVSSQLGTLQTLQTSHPSPKSADYGFFGCEHFYFINELLKKKNVEPIDWCDMSVA